MNVSDNKYQSELANTEVESSSLKDSILKVQEYINELIKHWKLAVLIIFPFVLFFLIKAWVAPVVYTATLTFMVNDDDGGNFGGVGAILGQFGLGGNTGGNYNLDKILELAHSRKIIQQALFEKREINGKEDFIANHIIDIYNLLEDWEDDTSGLADFHFTHNKMEDFSRVENSVLKRLYGLVVGGLEPGLLSTNFRKETGIMRMSSITESEALSIHLTEIVYDKLSTYYVEKTIEKQQQTYELVSFKADSIKNQLDKQEYALAKFQDSSRGLWTATTRLKESQLKREVSVLGILYAEALKNLEIADFSLKSNTPFVQLIDTPIVPLTPVGKSKRIAVLWGAVIGGLLAAMIILSRKIFVKEMGISFWPPREKRLGS